MYDLGNGMILQGILTLIFDCLLDFNFNLALIPFIIVSNEQSLFYDCNNNNSNVSHRIEEYNAINQQNIKHQKYNENNGMKYHLCLEKNAAYYRNLLFNAIIHENETLPMELECVQNDNTKQKNTKEDSSDDKVKSENQKNENKNENSCKSTDDSENMNDSQYMDIL